MRTRRIKRFVVQEDRYGTWELRLFFNSGRQQLISRNPDPRALLKEARELELVQPWEKAK